MAEARRSRRGTRSVWMLVAASLGLGVAPAAASAQYFGRNKVQYEDFDWQELHTDHFDFYFYPEEKAAVEDAGRMGERWYARLSRVFNHQFSSAKPVILYANHPDFQQTNTTEGQVGEGTGGFTESVKNRVVLPLTGVYADNDHVLGHELVHAFQYDIAQKMGAMGQQGIGALPLWLIEGMAEYLSKGRDDPLTAMWMRDAALRGDLPSFQQLTSDRRFFPYRYGQALWAYIGGRWGDRAVTDLFKASLQDGWSAAVKRVLRTSSDQLNQDWLTALRAHYLPLMEGKDRPGEVAQKILAKDIDAGDMNVGPALSPDGRYVAFYSERALFEITLFLADAHTGEVVKKVADSETSLHFDALSFLESAGAWSPDGKEMAFTAFADGDEELAVIRLADREIVRHIRIEGVGALNSPAWSPDGRMIAVAGNSGGMSNLYLVDAETGRAEQLTNDPYAELQPSWSPDGRTLAFVTDRAGTDLKTLEYGNMRIGLMDMGTRQVRMLDLFAGGKHIDPHYGPNGEWLYFISDADGFQDVYRVRLASGEIQRITRIATGVSGITDLSPALTIAQQTGDIMFSVFNEGNYTVYRMDAAQVEARAQPVQNRFAGVQPAAILPPMEAAERGIVASYMAEPLRGLPRDTVFPSGDYGARLALDYVGVPTLGASFGGPFGTMVQGAVATYWSDMLGNRQLMAAVQANGTFKDVGGQVQYVNRKGHLNWGLLAGHIPYRLGYYFYDPQSSFNGRPAVEQDLQLFRIYQDQAVALFEFPRSQTRRFEVNAGYMRYGFGLETLRVYYDAATGQQLGSETTSDTLPSELAHPLSMGTATFAYVGDWSNFGFTSPVRGGRFRFEVSPMFGGLNMVNALADYRRYFWHYPFTLAVRGMHYGRYGPDAENGNPLFTQQLFLGYETLVRGYDYNSFSSSECGATGVNGGCPVFNRLLGSKLAVASAELRLPLFGVPGFGLINFPFVPTELAGFVDAGVAWNSRSCGNDGSSTDSQGLSCTPVWKWNAPGERTPVVSAGITSRFNVLGFAVLEIYYAYPFQRPNKGWHFGFQLAPGW